MCLMVHIVCSPPWIQGRNKFWENFDKGGSTFFQNQEGKYFRRGTQISDISLDHPGEGEMPTQTLKKFFEYL